MPARHTATFPPLVMQVMTSPSNLVQTVLDGWVVQVVSVQSMMALATWPGVGVLPPQEAKASVIAMKRAGRNLVILHFSLLFLDGIRSAPMRLSSGCSLASFQCGFLPQMRYPVKIPAPMMVKPAAAPHSSPANILLCINVFGWQACGLLDSMAELWHFYTMRMYDVITWEEEGIWTAHSPSVPGVYGLGSTPDIANRDLSEALSLLSEYLQEIGEPMPRPHKLRTSQICV